MFKQRTTYRLILVVFFCLFIPKHYVFGQNTRVLTLDPAKSITQYGLSTWTSLDGLPQNTIGAIAQTPDGYVWIGTQEGLVRFDGEVFTVFNRKNTPALSTSTINHLQVTLDGSLLIGTRGGGLLTLTEGIFSTLTEEDGLSSNFSTSLAVDSNENIWFGTFGGGLNRISGSEITIFGADQGLVGQAVSFVSEASDGTIWAGTRDGVFVLEDDQFVPHPDPQIAALYVTAHLVESDGTTWIGTRQGSLFAYKGGQLTDHSSSVSDPGSYLKDIWKDVEGSLWFASRGNGLFRKTKKSELFEQFTEAEGLSNNGVLSLMEDREGGLWVGTNNGLNRLQDGKFNTYTTLEGLSNDVVRSVHEDASGTVWMATMDGVSSFKNGSFSHYGVADGLSSDNTFTVTSDHEGNIWVGTTGQGLNKISDDGIRIYSTQDGLSGMAIYALYTADDGRLWIGTENGLSIYDGEKFTNLTTEDGLSSPFVTDFEEAVDGEMWVSTYDGGVNLVSDDGISTINSKDGLANDGVFALYADSNGDVWIGTYGDGLNILRNGKLYHVDSRKGLFDDSIFSILEDDLGYMWFTSNQGIFRASKNDILDVAFGDLEHLDSRGYGISDGLKTSEANGGQQPAAWKGKDGRLWFPMAKGVVSVQPSTLPSNAQQPVIHIQSFIVDNQPFNLRQWKFDTSKEQQRAAITLPAGSDKLEFSYVGLSYVAPEKVRYEVMLKGHDRDWSPASTRKEAYFTNLGPGEYHFMVRAVNADGLWSKESEALAFVIEPFFYETVWFKLLSLLVIVLGLAAAYKGRVRHMKMRQLELEQTVEERTRDLRKEKEVTEKAKEVIEAQAERLKEMDQFKTRFFSNVSHEFRTPLTMLIGPLENALQGAYGIISDSMRQQSEIMLRNAQRLMRLINQLMDLSKLEAGKMQLQAQARNIVPFLEGLLLTFTPFAEKKHIELNFESSEEEIEVYFEPDKLEKVFYNLLSNAAKFTDYQGRITIEVSAFAARDSFRKGGVEIKISDTGKGIPSKDLPFIFDRFRQAEGSKSADQAGTGIGLSLVRELVVLHHGTIRVESELGKGTTFIVELHQDRLHLLEEDIVADGLADSNSMTELAAHDLNFIHGDEQNLAAANVITPEDAPTVLTVEDNKDVREYIASILNGMYHVLQAEDGEEGLKMVLEHHPDMIITDITMPKMDGNEMCRRIKSDERINHIPVLMLTARASFEGKLSGLEVGADDYMAKPFNARELHARVKNLIRLRNQDKELKLLNSDLSKQVQLQLDTILEEREQYENKLIVARDKAELSSRLKSTILDNMNHEFRTPLSTILGYSQILVEEAPDEFKEFAGAIEQGGQRLLTTLNGVIDLANVESTDYDLDLQEFDAGLKFESIVLGYTDIARNKGLTLNLHVDQRLNWNKTSSPDAFSKIVHLLLDNALKYTDSGEINARLTEDDHQLVIGIQDTGIGMSASTQEDIFTAFVQGDSGLSRSHEGSGIGLSIVKRLIEKLNGTIEVESQPGQGSAFTCRIPINSIATERMPQARRSRTPRLQHKKIVD